MGEFINKKYLEDFNWSEETRQQLSKLVEGSLVEAQIDCIDKLNNEVILKINDSISHSIPYNEINYNRSLSVGDNIKVYVEVNDINSGTLSLSHRKGRMYEAWDKVKEAYGNQAAIQGLIKCRTAGGFIVDIMEIEAFLPLSQIGGEKTSNFDDYVKTNMFFKIVLVDPINWIVVVSHKIIENPVFKMSSIVNELKLYEDFLFPSEYTLEDFINDGYPDKAKRRNRNGGGIPHVDEMVRTHGRTSPCPHCGSENIRTYSDGTAQCKNCYKWYYYA